MMLMRRVFTCALALSLILGLLLMSASNHGATASPMGIASTVTSDVLPDLGEVGETGVHCQCQTTIPSTIEIADLRVVERQPFDVAQDRERASVSADLFPEPPRV